MHRQIALALGLIITALPFTSCTKKVTLSPLQVIQQTTNDTLRNVLDHPEEYELQLVFSRIHREGDSLWVEDFAYQVNDSNYFYPASSVKFPAAVLALEKLNRDKRFNRNTPFFVEGDSIQTTMAQEISKIFAVSDNEAFNRLYEYLGPDGMNNRLSELNIGPVRYAHRLATDDPARLQTRPLIFSPDDTTSVLTESNISSIPSPLALNRIHKGIGYMDQDSLISAPMDFSLKNYLPVSSLHEIMKRLMLPELYKPEQRFELSTEDREFLLHTMSAPPSAQGYDPAEYPDHYVKFLMFGGKDSIIPPYIKSYNKVGFAYGYLTDCAYIKDEKNQIEMLITATLHVNKDKIFNDNVYEYDSVGIPFLGELGQLLYRYELDQKKN